MERPLATIGHRSDLCLDMQRLVCAKRHLGDAVDGARRAEYRAYSEALAPRNVFTRFIPRHGQTKRRACGTPLSEMGDVPAIISTPTVCGSFPSSRSSWQPEAIFDKLVYSAFHDGRLHAFLKKVGSTAF